EMIRDAIHEMTSHPLETLGEVARAPRRAFEAIGHTLSGMGSIVGMGAVPRGPFDAKTEPARRFATAEVSFERMRAIKRSLGGTVNDVVLTAVAMGLPR